MILPKWKTCQKSCIGLNSRRAISETVTESLVEEVSIDGMCGVY